MERCRHTLVLMTEFIALSNFEDITLQYMKHPGTDDT